MPTAANNEQTMRQRLRTAVDNLEHVLPGQFPLKDFVHHNTLHGYQHHSFPEALKQAHELTGVYGYLPSPQFRKLYQQGRISLADLKLALDNDSELDADTVVFEQSGKIIRQSDIYLCALLCPIESITSAQLAWNKDEHAALSQFQDDVPQQTRTALLESVDQQSEGEVIADLWQACLQSLELDEYLQHPEELMDLTSEQAEGMIRSYAQIVEVDEAENFRVRRQMSLEAEVLLGAMFKRTGSDYTLRGLLKDLTGEDIMDDIRPLLVLQLSNHLDHGVAALHSQDCEQGFYLSWRNNAAQDLVWATQNQTVWRNDIHALSDDAFDVVILELRRLGLDESQWVDYLQRLALELPGWSGMFMWRHLHQGYEGLVARIDMMDYLAVRLVLERLYAQRLCHQTWNISPDLNVLRWYFRHNKDEFLVRYALFNLELPEYVVNRAQRLTARIGNQSPTSEEWQFSAQVIWTWRHSAAADRPKNVSVTRSGWRLFRLAQHLAINGDALRSLSRQSVEDMLACITHFTQQKSGFIWLQAYEYQYRNQLFHAVQKNHGRGNWKTRQQTPDAQLVFCMDDREEGLRRHLEEYKPSYETLGAAGFFGFAINWKDIDATTTTALCPVVVTPSHEIHETVNAQNIAAKKSHDQRKRVRHRLTDYAVNATRHQMFGSLVATVLAAPLAILALLLKLIAPRLSLDTLKWLHPIIKPSVATQLTLTANDNGGEATADNNRLGFTESEQADRVQGFLKTIGLTKGFAPLVVLMGHGSSSENNPHLAAYDCGACSGKHGGPNARVFAAVANRPQVRKLLHQRGLIIPEHTWFIGAMHNTCDESIEWFDLDDLPNHHQPKFKKLRHDLTHAASGSAHERCRKLMSAPANPKLQQARKHMRSRSYDISQARPELGHATNAAAFIGRRSMSQGAFLDRRVFLISYDPSNDPGGKIIENILLNAGPVGAGINLEYYFSTVNNDQYGCSTKITHNVTGFFGVIDGAESDLRTGLPQQMVEIHEAMRLQVLVEAKKEILTEIYQRQPALQELVGNGWILLSAKDPDSAKIDVFDPKHGWQPWQSDQPELTTVKDSKQWYRNHREHLPPALIEQASRLAHG